MMRDVDIENIDYTTTTIMLVLNYNFETTTLHFTLQPPGDEKIVLMSLPSRRRPSNPLLPPEVMKGGRIRKEEEKRGKSIKRHAQ